MKLSEERVQVRQERKWRETAVNGRVPRGKRGEVVKISKEKKRRGRREGKQGGRRKDHGRDRHGGGKERICKM